MRVASISDGCIFAWIFDELVWSSLLGLIMVVFFGFGTTMENLQLLLGIIQFIL